MILYLAFICIEVSCHHYRLSVGYFVFLHVTFNRTDSCQWHVLFLANTTWQQNPLAMQPQLGHQHEWTTKIRIQKGTKVIAAMYAINVRRKTSWQRQTIRRLHYIVMNSIQKVYGLYVTMWWGRRIAYNTRKKFAVPSKNAVSANIKHSRYFH